MSSSAGRPRRAWPPRRRRPGAPPPPFPQPRWDGSDLAGKTILLHTEQGLGDTLLFVRYARLVQEGPLLPLKARGLLFILHASVSHRMNLVAEKETAAGTMRRVAPHLLFNSWIALLHYYVANRDVFAPRESVLAAKGDELVGHFLNLVRK